MSEELQNLLERIQKDGVEKAEGEADKIISEAKEKAETIIKEAKDQAAKTIEQAEIDGKAFAERSKKSLDQSARDVILSVKQAVDNTLKNIVSQNISEALSDDTLKPMLAQVAETYFSKKEDSGTIEVLINPEQQKKVTDFFMAKYANAMKSGLEVKADSGVVAGFKVSVVKDKVEHDFSEEAITDAICQLLRPALAEIVRNTEK